MEGVSAMYDALTIAMYIINKCFEEGAPVTNLRLQKLLYFIQGRNYMLQGQCLIEEDFFAWPYGPVIPEIYFKFCGYSGAPIRRHYDVNDIAKNDMNVIDETIDLLMPYDDWTLVRLSHETDAPWYKYKDNRELIPKKDIKRYFERL